MHDNPPLTYCDICGKPSKYIDPYFQWYPCSDHAYLEPNEYILEALKVKTGGRTKAR